MCVNMKHGVGDTGRCEQTKTEQHNPNLYTHYTYMYIYNVRTKFTTLTLLSLALSLHWPVASPIFFFSSRFSIVLDICVQCIFFLSSRMTNFIVYSFQLLLFVMLLLLFSLLTAFHFSCEQRAHMFYCCFVYNRRWNNKKTTNSEEQDARERCRMKWK